MALERKVPTVSDVFIGATAKRPIVSVNVPIVRDGQVIGLINTGIDPYRLSQILQEQGVAETWTAAIVDRTGKIVARSRQAERIYRDYRHGRFEKERRWRRGYLGGMDC